MSHFWPDSLIAGVRPFRARISCCGDSEGVFLHLELSGMLRQHMEDSHGLSQQEIDIYCVRSLRLRGCLFWQHNLAYPECSRYKDVIKFLLQLIVRSLPDTS